MGTSCAAAIAVPALELRTARCRVAVAQECLLCCIRKYTLHLSFPGQQINRSQLATHCHGRSKTELCSLQLQCGCLQALGCRKHYKLNFKVTDGWVGYRRDVEEGWGKALATKGNSHLIYILVGIRYVFQHGNPLIFQCVQ